MFLRNYKFDFFVRGFNRKFLFKLGVCDWKINHCVRCLKILLVRILQEVLFILIHSDVHTSLLESYRFFPNVQKNFFYLQRHFNWKSLHSILCVEIPSVRKGSFSWFSSIFKPNFLHNYLLDFFHEGLGWQFFSWWGALVLTSHWLCSMRWNFRSLDIPNAAITSDISPILQLMFSIITNYIPSVKIPVGKIIAGFYSIKFKSEALCL